MWHIFQFSKILDIPQFSLKKLLYGLNKVNLGGHNAIK